MQKLYTLITTVIISTILLTTPAAAAIITVAADGSGDHLTIQAGIDAAVNGDTVLVKDGTYIGADNKNLDFAGEAITLISENGPENCIIDCENSGRGFYFHSGEGPDSIVSGLTIKNGYITEPVIGGAIYCSGSSPTIAKCFIVSNKATGKSGLDGAYGSPAFGGGIFCSSSSFATITNCKILNNSAKGGNGGSQGGMFGMGGDGGFAYGGGIYFASSMTIENCIVISNKAEAGEGGWGIEREGFPGDAYGGGICSDGDGLISNCTICYNSVSGEVALGAGVAVNGPSSASTINSILWGNGDDIYNCPATYSCIEDGDAGVGNISSDPLFVTGPLGDYYLSQIAAGQATDSLCVDAGSDTAANLGMSLFTTRTDQSLDTGDVDMGYHYPSDNSPDLDNDGDDDIFDYIIFAIQWQQIPGSPSAGYRPRWWR